MRWSAGREITAATSLDDLGLSSLDRVELLVALEQKLGAPVDETAVARARTVADLNAIRLNGTAAAAAREPDFRFPRWSRHPLAHAFRAFNQELWLLRLASLFAWVRVEGREHLRGLKGPALIVSNHQSYFDTPAILLALPWRWRRRLVPTMRKEFFDAHFHPSQFGLWHWFTNSLNYVLSLLMFNAFPLPQREAGTRAALREIGQLAAAGWCPLIFPEGRHSRDETLLKFQPGGAMMAARLQLPVVPIRIRGANKVLHPDSRFARPGRIRVTIGAPLWMEGEDYLALTHRLEESLRAL